MAVFYKVIRDSPDPKLQSAPCHGSQNCPLKVPLQYATPDENHSLQTHCIDLDYFEKATLLRLEQMGMRAQKMLVKKTKKKTKEDMKEGDENSSNEEEETIVVMFDIEKISMETCIAPESVLISKKDRENSVEVKVGSNVNIFALEKKTRVSFDDILASIHYSIDNNKTQSDSSESEDEEDSS